MGDTVIRVEGVAKKFCRRLRYSMYYGALDVARGMMGMESRTESLRPGEFWAVDDVSFELKRGETLGLIGANGSGKSTLLRLINGIFPPDRGRIEIKGRVGALIAVGAGFHPLMTGRENIYLNGAIMGMGRREIDRKFDSIVDFADIGEFLDAPVKTYSSGMYVRLGFAVAIHSEPDILLVDEVLAVGDARFQQRCFSKIGALQESGASVVLVTHNTEAVLRHCQSAIMLAKGSLLMRGEPKETVNRYLSMLWDQPEDEGSGRPGRAPAEKRPVEADPEDRCTLKPNYNPGETRFGNGRARIVDFETLDAGGEETTSISSGGTLRLRVTVLFKDEVKVPVYGFAIKTKDGLLLHGTNTHYSKTRVEPRKAGEVQVVEFSLNLSLGHGDYFLSSSVVEMTSGAEEVLDRRYDLVHVQVAPAGIGLGMVNLFSEIALGHER